MKSFFGLIFILNHWLPIRAIKWTTSIINYYHRVFIRFAIEGSFCLFYFRSPHSVLVPFLRWLCQPASQSVSVTPSFVRSSVKKNPVRKNYFYFPVLGHSAKRERRREREKPRRGRPNFDFDFFFASLPSCKSCCSCFLNMGHSGPLFSLFSSFQYS